MASVVDPTALFAAVAATIADAIKSEAASSLVTAGRDKLQQRTAGDMVRWQLALALTRTTQRFAERHREWCEALFDETFLTCHAAPLLARALSRRGSVSAAELADLWVRKGLGGATAEARRAEAEAVAGEFLNLWTEELAEQPPFSTRLDSRAMERTATGVEALAEIQAEIVTRLGHIDRHLTRASHPKLVEHIHWESREYVRSARTLMPRPWMLAELDAFAARSRCGYVTIEGEAGIGKTAVARTIAADRAAAAFFFSQGNGAERPDRCLRHLCAELIQRFGLGRDALPEHAGEDASTLAELLHAATRLGEQVWILIDGLDEADYGGRHAGMPLPRVLPRGAFLVLTQRPGRFATLPSDVPEWPIRMSPDSARQQADIGSFLERETRSPRVLSALEVMQPRLTPSELASRLAAASEGNFMYVSSVLDHIANRYDPPLPLDSLPRGLDRFYELMWSHMAADRDSDRWRRVRRPVINRLAVAGEPVSAQWLADHVGTTVDDVSDGALEAWKPFLRRHEVDGETRWSIVHQSFRHFLVATNRLDAAAVHADVARYYASPSRWTAHRAYASRRLVSHLREAHASDDLLELVQRPKWQAAQLTADASGAALLKDVDTAWSVAAEIDAARHDGPPPQLLRHVKLALTAAAIHQRSAELPVALLERALTTGAWRLEQVVNAARLRSDPRQRAEALAALTPLAPSWLLREIEHESALVTDLHARLTLLISLLARQPGDQRLEDSVWQCATEPASEQDQARALERMAPVMNQRLSVAAEAFAAAFTQASARGRVLGALPPPADLWRRRERAEALLTLAPHAEVPELEAKMLAAAARLAVPSQLRRIARRARALHDVAAAASIASICLRRLDGSERDLLASAMRTRGLAGGAVDRRATVLARMAPFLPGAEIARITDEILSAAERSATPRQHARALSRLWPMLREPDRSEALGRLHVATAGANSPALTGLAFAEVAHLLAEPELREAVLIATSESAGVDGPAILAKLAPWLPQDLVRLALGGQARRARGARLRVFAALAPALSGDQREIAIEEALQDLDAADLSDLQKLAPVIPTERRRVLVDELLERAAAVGPAAVPGVAGRIELLSLEPWADLIRLLDRVESPTARAAVLDYGAAHFAHPPPATILNRVAAAGALSERAATRLATRLSAELSASFVASLPEDLQRGVLRELAERNPTAVRELVSRVPPDVVDVDVLARVLPAIPGGRFEAAAARVLQHGSTEAVVEALELMAARVDTGRFETLAAPLLEAGRELALPVATALARQLPEPIGRPLLKPMSSTPEQWANAVLLQRGEGMPVWLTELALERLQDPVAAAYLLGVARRKVNEPVARAALAVAQSGRHSALGPHALQVLAPYIPGRLLPDALNVALDLLESGDFEAADAALAALGSRLRGGDLDSALKRLERREAECLAHRFLVGLFPHLRSDAAIRAFDAAVRWRLPGSDVARWVTERMPPGHVLVLVHEMTDATAHAGLLAALAPRLNPAVVDAFVDRIAAGRRSRDRDVLLSVLAASSSDTGFRRVLDVVVDDDLAAETIVSRSGDLSEAVVFDVLDRVERMAARAPAVKALTALFPRLPEVSLGRAFAISDRLTAAQPNSRLAVASAPHLDARRTRQVMALTREIDGPLERAHALVALAPSARRFGVDLYADAVATLRVAATRGDVTLADAVGCLAPLLCARGAAAVAPTPCSQARS